MENNDDLKDKDLEEKGDELINEVRKLKDEMVSKDDYVKLMNENKALVKELTNNRTVVEKSETKEVTSEDIIKRCQERTNSLTGDNSYDAVKALVDNFDDMNTLGMDTSNIDANIVEGLKELIVKADGDKEYFKALLEKSIKL